MAAELTPEQLAQIWETVWNNLQANGVDYKAELIAPLEPADWQKIKIIARDERDPGNIKGCNLDLKAAFDAYGGDVEAIVQTVQKALADTTRLAGEVVTNAGVVAEHTATTTRLAGEVESNASAVSGHATTITRLAGEVESNASAVATNTTITTKASEAAVNAETYIRDTAVPFIDGKATAAAGSATKAEQEAASASASAGKADATLTAVNQTKAEVEAIKDQVIGVVAQVATPTVLIGSTLYREATIVKNGRILKKYEIVK